jgi:hypothetical protein
MNEILKALNAATFHDENGIFGVHRTSAPDKVVVDVNEGDKLVTYTITVTPE